MSTKELVWQPGYSVTNRPARKSRSTRVNPPQTGRTGPNEFIIENPGKANQRDQYAKSPDLTHDSSAISSVSRSSIPSSNVGENYPLNISPHDENTAHLIGPTPGTSPATASSEASMSPSPPDFVSPSHLTIPCSIQFSSLIQRYVPLLNRYNIEFCRIPLTSDMLVNPFRYNANPHKEPMFLIHAVMALACHHVGSTEMDSHRHASSNLMRLNLVSSNLPKRVLLSALDAIVITFSLDETQSAIGPWNTHLTGAYGLLEACGGLAPLMKSQKSQVQVAILVWWDAIISLVAREQCVFPISYFDMLVQEPVGLYWDYFGLCGCPLELVQIAMKLSHLASERSRTTIGCSYQGHVTDLEAALMIWQHHASCALECEEDMHQDRDKMHCSEAWRSGLLLYIYRVFQWQPGEPVALHIPTVARTIVDHVFACRNHGMTARQALLPLFFAGCELQDPSLRRKILNFCAIWGDQTRYHMFYTTVPLLEEVWREQDSKGFENV